MNLRVKFSLFIVLLVFCVLSIATFLLVFLRINQIQKELLEKDKITSQLLAVKLSDSFADYYYYQYDTYLQYIEETKKEFPDLLGFRMYNPDGEILFDSDSPVNNSENESQIITGADDTVLSSIKDRREIGSIIEKNKNTIIQTVTPYSDKFGVYRNAFEFYFSTSSIQEALRETIVYYAVLLVVLIFLSVIVAILTVQRIVKPILELTEAAKNFSEGKTYTLSTVSATDEIGTLSKAFIQMSKDLEITHRELKQQNVSLEEEVEKRTKELSDQVIEMRKLEQIMIGRELKMAELKNELDKLK